MSVIIAVLENVEKWFTENVKILTVICLFMYVKS